MKRCRALLLALSAALLLTAPGCLGQFAMTGAVRKFNLETVDGQWPREILFIGLYIIPAYPIAAFGDLFIVNSIEFWTKENPITGDKAITLSKAEAGTAEDQRAEAPEVAGAP